MAVAGLPTKKKVNTTALGNAIKNTAKNNTASTTTAKTTTVNPPVASQTTSAAPYTLMNTGGTKTNTTTYSPTTTYTPVATGNYTIGSDKGKEIAFNLPIGQPFVASDGAVWTKENDGSITVNYNGTTTKNAYTMPDWGVLGDQQMAAGLPWEVVNTTRVNRNNKISNDPSLSQYSGDSYDTRMANYINQNIRLQNQPNMTSGQIIANYDATKPTYEDQYNPQIQALLNQILNRDDFSYDAENDPLFQQYKSMYQREGDRAMRDTLAEAAASAGGMNSYAIGAAQQANNYYAAQLGDKIPELYQLAYEMYLADKESDIQNLGILNQLSDTQYARYRDTMSDWRGDRDFAYGVYRDDVADGQWDAMFDYNAYTGDRDFNYGVSNDNWEKKKYEEETDYKKQQDSEDKAKAEKEEALAMIDLLINNGASFESVAAYIPASGLPESAVREMIAKRDSGNFRQASSGNGGGGDGGSGEYGGGGTPIEGDGVEWTKAAYDLGLPAAISQDVIADLVEAGAVVINGDSAYWTDGWNAGNYAAKLKLIY